MPIELSEAKVDLTLADPGDQLSSRPESSLYAVGSRSTTIASRYEAVERVILAIRERWYERMSLRDMAEIALLSPYHFNRVFRRVTGVPPCKFLSVLRMEAAKRLFITTQFTVSDVCFGIGYNSLGSFTRDFTRLVGLSPQNFRRLAQDTTRLCADPLYGHDADHCRDPAPGTGLAGRISAPDNFARVAFVGLFTTPIPQGRPVGCALLSAPGSYRIANVPDGTYYLFAAAFPRSNKSLVDLLLDQTNAYVGARHQPLRVSEGTVSGDADITLRKLRLTDPPILVALPLLLIEHLSSHEMATA